MTDFESNELVRRLIELALLEDEAASDITSEICLPEGAIGEALILAREELIVCGLPLLPVIAAQGKAELNCVFVKKDGDRAMALDPLAILSGSLFDILRLERTVLNFLQRLSGIATFTKRVVEQAQGVQLLDTRKTTPGHRVLEKYAVRIGGGVNHRASLADMMLIKNNHIDAHPQGVAGVLAEARKRKPPYLSWEVEVRDIEELREALTFSPDVIMLDNMDDAHIERALELVANSGKLTKIEISGGITPERLPRLKAMGVTYVSLGGLTTQARAVDISLRVKKV